MKHTLNFKHYLFSTALLVTLGGCASSEANKSTGQYIDDAAITAKVKTALLKDPTVKGLQIQVETYKGTVQLSGFADTREEAKKAQELASSVEGVQSVKNDIRLKN